MRTMTCAVVAALLCAVAPAWAAPPSPAAEPVEHWWWHRNGEVPVGVVRVVETPITSGGTHTDETGELRPWQNGAERPLQWSRLIDEDADGGMVFFHNESAAAGRYITSEGKVAGEQLKLEITEHGKDPVTRDVAWPAGVLGPVGVRKLRVKKGFTPGTRYTYLAWDFDQGRVISWQVHVETAADTYEDATGKVTAARLCLHQVSPKPRTAADGLRLEWWTGGRCVRRWVTGQGDESRVRIPKAMGTRGTGIIAVYSVSEFAPVEGGVHPVTRPSALTAATYRCRLTEGKWGEVELNGPGQKAAKLKDGSIAFQVTAQTLPKSGHPLPLTPPKGQEAGLQDGYFVGLEGEALKKIAAGIVGGETSGAKAAAKIVAAVGARLRKNALNPGMATALEAWRQREGDCLEHATCVVALCRAAGIPARLAGGLRYVQFGSKAYFAFHAWAEVWLGKWIGVDAMTPGQRCDAARIRLGTGWLGGDSPETCLVNGGTLVKRLQVTIAAAAQGKLKLGGDTLRINGTVCEDPAWGIRLTTVPGFKFTGADPSVPASIAVVRGKRGRRINIRAGTVPLHQDPWYLARTSGFQVENAVEMEIDGVAALVADLSQGGGYVPRTMYVVDGETLFVVDYPGRAEDGLAAFEALLAQWRWLGRKGS